MPITSQSSTSIPQLLTTALIRHVLGYIAFAINIPVVVLFVGMCFFAMIALQDVYGIALLKIIADIPFIGNLIPSSFSINGEMIVNAYIKGTLIIYVVMSVIRSLFHIKPLPFRKRLIIFSIITGSIWLFYIIHLPFINISSNGERIGIGLIFTLFLAVTISCYALSGAIHKIEQKILNGILRKITK